MAVGVVDTGFVVDDAVEVGLAVVAAVVVFGVVGEVLEQPASHNIELKITRNARRIKKIIS